LGFNLKFNGKRQKAKGKRQKVKQCGLGGFHQGATAEPEGHSCKSVPHGAEKRYICYINISSFIDFLLNGIFSVKYLCRGLF
jgi:hypothetical protein